MPWEEDLFAVLDDLEQQAEALYDSERGPELADRSRAEYAQVEMEARLMACLDTEIGLHVLGVGLVRGGLGRVAAGWCVLHGPAGDWIVCTAAVLAVDGAGDRAVPRVAWSPVTRLGVGSALRRLGEAGERCVAHRVDGVRHDGVVARVGRDFVELVEGDPPRTTLLALAGLAALQSFER